MKPKKKSEPQSVSLEFDSKIFHPEALLGAAHIFSDRARVFVRHGGVTLERKEGSPEASLSKLAEEFQEEATAQELRHRIADENRDLQEYIVTKALLSSIGKHHEPPAAEAPAEPGGEEVLASMTRDQEQDIARLIQEAEREIQEREERRKGVYGQKPSGADPAKAA